MTLDIPNGMPHNGMRGVSGLGAAAPDCSLVDVSTDPCSWLDSVYMRDACFNYKYCSDPAWAASKYAQLMQSGVIVGGAGVVGGAVGSGIQNFTTHLFQDPTTPGAINWMTIAIVGVSLFVLLPRLTSR